MLMDPAFPDIVGEWAEETAREVENSASWANDNDQDESDPLSDPFLPLLLKAEIEATRVW
jgi:hypothetical protein